MDGIKDLDHEFVFVEVLSPHQDNYQLYEADYVSVI